MQWEPEVQNITIKRERMTVDLLLFQAYGAAGQGLVAATLEANPGIAEVGPILPLGTIIAIPDKPAADPFTARPVVSLFG